jgi:cytochrome c-type biogenesis protein CcmH/NrfF
MFGRIGVPETFVVLVMFVLWLTPLVAAVWALVTLYRVRRDQEAMLTKLSAIERRLAQ